VRVTVVRPGFVQTDDRRHVTGPLSGHRLDVADVVADAVRNQRELVWAPGPLRAVMSALRHVPADFRRLPL